MKATNTRATSSNGGDDTQKKLKVLLEKTLLASFQMVDQHHCTDDQYAAKESIGEVWIKFQESTTSPEDTSHKDVIRVKYENGISQWEAMGFCSESEGGQLRNLFGLYLGE